MIHPNLQGTVFAIADVVTLDTTGLHGAPFDWRHYGGPLAMFRFCRFVRTQILGDEPAPRKVVPMPRSAIYQVGDMILTQVDEIPANAAPVEIESLPDGSIPLGGGYVLKSGGRANNEDP